MYKLLNPGNEQTMICWLVLLFLGKMMSDSRFQGSINWRNVIQIPGFRKLT